MDLNVIVICVKKKVEIHDKMEYLPGKDYKISESIPTSKTSTKNCSELHYKNEDTF